MFMLQSIDKVVIKLDINDTLHQQYFNKVLTLLYRLRNLALYQKAWWNDDLDILVYKVCNLLY